MAAKDWFEQISDEVRPVDCGPQWYVYSLSTVKEEVPEGYVKLTGCDTDGVYQRGSRKGQPKFKGHKNKRSVFMTMERYRELAKVAK